MVKHFKVFKTVYNYNIVLSSLVFVKAKFWFFAGNYFLIWA